MENIEKSMAILIDAENISSKYIGLIIDDANKHGKLNYRRIYGDWTSTKLKKWKDACLNYALTPVQQFSSKSGKNSSDFSLVIDAMDILNSGKVNGFCIISSDGDFTKLITRLKEDDMYVVGMGEEKTPISLVSSFESFTYLDKLFKVIEEEKKVKAENEKKSNGKKPLPTIDSKDTSITPEVKIVSYLKILIHNESDEEGWAYWGTVADLLKKKYPGFHPRNYGKNMKELRFFKEMKEFTTKTENTSLYIRIS
jgi:uncharacterized LabA/DUF88 family protein